MNETVKIFVVALIASIIGGFVAGWIGGNQSASPQEQSFGYTSLANNPFRMPNSYADFGGGYYVDSAVIIDTNGSLTVTATTTIAKSYDGFLVGGGITPASIATNTVFTLYSHSGGRAFCDTEVSNLFADSTGYSPALTISIGTSTSAGYSTNLVASSTLATTTDAFVDPSTYKFVLESGDEITAFLADVNSNASSTYFANWDIEYQTLCWLIGG